MVSVFDIEHGYMKGKGYTSITSSGLAAGDERESIVDNGREMKQRLLIDVIIETISKCADDSDEIVHLQVWLESIEDCTMTRYSFIYAFLDN